jgi:hypothetical protein
MLSHTDFILKMVRAAQAGEDLAAFLDNEREHLISCELCQQASLALLGDALGEEELQLVVERAESGDPQLEPGSYPSFDFTFIENAQGQLWRSTQIGGEPDEQGKKASREGKETRKYYVLRHTVEILVEQTGTRLGELAAALQPLRLAPIAVRGEQALQPEGLILEDTENEVRISLRLTEQRQLNVLLSAGEQGAVKPGRLALMTTAEPRRTLQRMALKPGEEASLPLTRGDLIIQVAQGPHTWEIPIRVR